MFKIALIDDLDFAIPQVKNSIPEWVDYEFFYYPKYKLAVWEKFDIALIDYYLDLENVRWEDIVNFIDAKVKIGFSTVKSCSDKIQKAWADYSVHKLNSNKNEELEEVMMLAIYSDLNKKNTD